MTEIPPARKRWPFIAGLLLLNVVYLAAEAVFNSSLLDLVVQRDVSLEDLESIELVGRSIAGAGASLLLLGLLAPRGTSPYWLVPILLLTFALVYFGQKWGIDYYVDQTTADQRANAQRMLYLKQGLITGHIEIDKFPNHLIEPDEPLIPASRTFIALMGWLAPTSPEFQTVAESRLDQILLRVLDEESDQKSEGAYANYQDSARNLNDLYETYRKADRQYAKAKSGDPGAADGAWREVNEGVLGGYDKWLSERKRFDQRIANDADELHPHLLKYFEDRGRCGNSEVCQRRFNSIYEDRFAPRLGGGSWEDWCEPVYGREFFSAGKTGDGFDLQFKPIVGAVAAVEKLIGKEKLRGYDCSGVDDVSHVEARLREKKLPEFEAQGGYPYSTSRDEYLRAPLTSERVARDLRADGFSLPAGWTLDDRQAFIEAYNDQIRSNADPRWNRKMRELVGTPLLHNLSREAFFAHSAVQDRMSSALGEMYREGMTPDMNRSEFEGEVIYPNLEAEAEAIVDLLTEGTDKFADGEEKATEGKQAVRTLIVPNVALLISAIVVVLTLIKSFWLLLSLLPLDWIRNRVPALVGGVVKLGVSVAVVVAIPASLSNPFTKSEGFSFFMAEARDANPAVWASSFYLMRLQPELAPIGTEIRRMMELSDPRPQRTSEPADSPVPGSNPEVDTWLRKADRAIAADQLTTPRNASAVHFYERAQAIDASDPRIAEGFEKVANRYAELAEARPEPLASQYRDLSTRMGQRAEAAVKASEQAEPTESAQNEPLPLLPKQRNPVVVLGVLSAFGTLIWLLIAWPKASRQNSIPSS